MKRQLKMESDTDSTESFASPSSFARLGKCEVCDYENAKYTCPKCEVKTCCIKCLNIHKKELNCDGIRDRTKFIPLKKMTKMDFMSDYYFLEECTRFVEDRKTDKIKRYTRYNKTLPPHLFKLRNAALERKTTIRFLLPNFTRHTSNTTYYDWSKKVIYWRVEWIFVNANSSKYVDERCCEDIKLHELLDKYFNVENHEEVPMKKSLEVYQSRGVGNVKILLKAEGIKRCRKRYYELDCKKTLRENLAGKILVEYPIVHICYDAVAEEYDVIDSDEDVIAESKKYRQTLDELYPSKHASAERLKAKEGTKSGADADEKRRKRAERKKRQAEREKQPKNLLFTEDKSDDDTSSDSEASNETEEEVELSSTKA